MTIKQNISSFRLQRGEILTKKKAFIAMFSNPGTKICLSGSPPSGFIQLSNGAIVDHNGKPVNILSGGFNSELWHIVKSFDDVCEAAKERGVTACEISHDGDHYVRLKKAGNYIDCGAIDQCYAQAIKILELGLLDDEHTKLKRVGEPLPFEHAIDVLLRGDVMVQPSNQGALGLVFRDGSLRLINDGEYDPARCLAVWAREHVLSDWYIVEEIADPSFEDVRKLAGSKGVVVSKTSDPQGGVYVCLSKGGNLVDCGPKIGKACSMAMKILELGVLDFFL